MKLTVLGSGTMVPTKEKNPSGFLFEAEGRRILLDAGPGTMRRLTDLGIDIQSIDLVFISHFHTDHFGEAFSLIHSRFVDDIYKGNKYSKKLTFLCPRGTEERFGLWRKIFWVEPEESYPIEFKEGVAKIEETGLEIEIFPVKHVRWFDSVGIILNYKGKKIVYTGDVGSEQDFEELAKKCKNADLLITEASFEKPTPNHYTIGQIKELVKHASVKKVLVVHVRPQHEERVRDICEKEPEFIFGEDKEIIEI
jgi:ribonuclease BN (tRNA processing enzyme)